MLPIDDLFFESAIDLTCIVLVGFAIKVWIALESARARGEVRRRGALELVLSILIETVEIIYAHAVIGVFLVVESIALSCLGMRFGFRARKPIRAAALALLGLLGLPVLLFLFPGYLILTSSAFDQLSMLMFGFVLGLGADLVAIYTQDNLLSEFRLIASEGPKRKPAKMPPFNAAPAPAEIS